MRCGGVGYEGAVDGGDGGDVEVDVVLMVEFGRRRDEDR